jgi:NADPH:quinone reductase-like Zn-dependent oxidoreductase
MAGTMRAAYLTAHGGNEAVAIGERPRPARGPGEVLVRLRAATLNRVDLYMRDSGAGITHSLPLIMGVDGAGVIEALDPAERRLSVGQEVVLYPAIVCGACEFCRRGDQPLCTAIRVLGEHRDGTFAEWVSLPAANLFPAPPGFTAAEAASLGVNFLTAWRMLFGKARLQPWETVLVFGIGSGVALAALQLARTAGARVIVTSRSDEKLARATALGAAAAINGRAEDVVARVMAATGGRGVDVVVESVGREAWPIALKSVVRGGRIVTCGATSGDDPSADLRRVFIRQLQILGSTLGSFEEFRTLLAFCARHQLKPVIDSSWPLAGLHGALDRLAAGAQFGKLVIDPTAG